MSDGPWDEATVRECARRVFDCQMCDPDNENPTMRIACANQALLAHDKLMRMGDMKGFWQDPPVMSPIHIVL